MKILVGLGNPGVKFFSNRHNVGFMVIDKLASIYSSEEWKSKFNAQICNCVFNGEKILLAKPDTFMNNSGPAVNNLKNFYKVDPSKIFVFHDELDLDTGTVRFKKKGGHAGHNGVRSINQFIGENYNRVRIGIGRPSDKNRVSSYVLSNFNESELKAVNKIISIFTDSISELINHRETEVIAQISTAIKE